MGLKKFNEFVQLDELSKRTLGDYIMHATQSYANHQEKRNKHRDDAQIVGRMDHNASGPVRQSVASTVDTLHKAANVHDDKRHKRGRGIMKAVKRLTAEGVEAVTDEEIDEIFENFEQLDEISKQTLGNYVKKAANEVGFSSHDFGSAQQRAVSAKRGSQDELDNTNAAHAARLKAVKRFNGIRKAADKLVKEGAEALSFDELELLGENFEQLDELSKDTLKSYIKKATAVNKRRERILVKQDAVIRAHGMYGWDDQAQRASEIIGKHVKPFHRRRNSIELAKRKLAEDDNE